MEHRIWKEDNIANMVPWFRLSFSHTKYVFPTLKTIIKLHFLALLKVKLLRHYDSLKLKQRKFLRNYGLFFPLWVQFLRAPGWKKTIYKKLSFSWRSSDKRDILSFSSCRRTFRLLTNSDWVRTGLQDRHVLNSFLHVIRHCLDQCTLTHFWTHHYLTWIRIGTSSDITKRLTNSLNSEEVWLFDSLWLIIQTLYLRTKSAGQTSKS